MSLAVRLTPKSSRDEIVGVEHLSDGRAVLKARVRAVPEAGAANEALIRLLAKSLSFAPSGLRLEFGQHEPGQRRSILPATQPRLRQNWRS